MFKRKKYKLKIFLKSGHTICIKCREWKFEYNKETAEYNGYTFTGLSKRCGIVPSQIAGYIVIR